MKRFLLFALPVLFALFALFHLGLEMAGYEPELGRLIGRRAGGPGLPAAWALATWALEALALAALYLLIVGPGVARFSSGLLAAWIAWVFRGPLLVITAVGYGGLAHGPWWQLSLRWLVLYTVAGALLGALGGLLPRPVPPPDQARPVEPNPPAPRS
ncbi:MAG TPA: hypothetical protein VF100_05790, partial [Thermoanaerobaculia bacterium]